MCPHGPAPPSLGRPATCPSRPRQVRAMRHKKTQTPSVAHTRRATMPAHSSSPGTIFTQAPSPPQAPRLRHPRHLRHPHRLRRLCRTRTRRMPCCPCRQKKHRLTKPMRPRPSPCTFPPWACRRTQQRPPKKRERQSAAPLYPSRTAPMSPKAAMSPRSGSPCTQASGCLRTASLSCGPRRCAPPSSAPLTAACGRSAHRPLQVTG